MKTILIIVLCVVGVLYVTHEAKSFGENIRQKQEARLRVTT